MADEESTLVLAKPDAVRRGLIGELFSRLERKGLRIEEMRMMLIDRELAENHYAEHKDKPFFPGLVEFITSGPVVAAKVTGQAAIEVVRTMMGPTNSAEAPPGTIRGDFGLTIGGNLIHGSDSPASAARELGLFFGG